MAVDVVVSGVTGKTGKVIALGVADTSDMELVGAVAPNHAGRTLSSLIDLPGSTIEVAGTVAEALATTPADVLIDFTTPAAALSNTLSALEAGARPVVGTTGLSADDLKIVDARARDRGLPALVAPNFSIGGLLLERLASQVAVLMPMVEVIELHHVQKKDAPSGTASRLAGRLAASGARAPVPVHSVRLPGLVAHHEVLFGGQGELLTLRHDTTSREAFVPGVLIAVRAVMHAPPGLITDLWPYLQAVQAP